MREQHYTKRLYFFDYLGETCEAPPSYYDKFPLLHYPIQQSNSENNIYKIIDMKRAEYGF